MKEEVEKLRRDNEALTNNNNDTEAALDTTKTKLDNLSQSRILGWTAKQLWIASEGAFASQMSLDLKKSYQRCHLLDEDLTKHRVKLEESRRDNDMHKSGMLKIKEQMDKKNWEYITQIKELDKKWQVAIPPCTIRVAMCDAEVLWSAVWQAEQTERMKKEAELSTLDDKLRK
eukprot:3656388-Rhodomonas_salina.1